MSKIAEYKERLARMNAQAAGTKERNLDEMEKEFRAVSSGISNETQVEVANSKFSAAPTTVRDTARVAQDEQVRALHELESLYEQVIAQAESDSELRSEVARLRSELANVRAESEKEKNRRMEFDVAGDFIRGPFNKETHERILTTTSQNERVRAMQADSDSVALMYALMQAGRNAGRFDPVVKGCKSVKETRAFARLANVHTRALYTTGSNAGDELIQNVLSAQVHDLFEMERRVAANIPQFQMPRGEFSLPVVTANPTWYLQGERSSDDGAYYDSSSMSTDTRAFVAKTLAALCYYSEEFDEDSIEAVLPWHQRVLATSAAGAEEDVLLNGDTDNSLDTGLSLATNSHLRAFDGFRELAQSGAKTDLSTFNTANALAALAKMGKYAMPLTKLILVPSVKVFLKHIVGSSDFTTWEKLGSAAANVTGSVGIFYGMPVIPSDKILETLNASGAYDGSTTTYTAAVVVRPDAYMIGRKRGITIQGGKEIRAGQLYVVASMREIMKKIEPSTALSEAIWYKMS